MNALPESAAWGVAVGGSLVVGTLVAVRVALPERVAALATTFGGGLLLAALAFELVPEADGARAAGGRAPASPPARSSTSPQTPG
jgi:hypothetical protein